MSASPVKMPSRRRLLLIGAGAACLAGAIVATGLVERAHHEHTLVQWTDRQAIPTVALAKLTHAGTTNALTLPGEIQPYQKAAIYARVSGYLKSWQEDIGAHVKAGQLLASIDTPDLDQELEQAGANLATAQANAQLAAVTARRWQALLPSSTVAQQSVDDKVGAAAATKAVFEAAQANVRQLLAMEGFKRIVAPFDGVVTQRKTDVGALINAGNSTGQELFEVSDLHKVRIYVPVPQAFSDEVTPGLKASFVMPQQPGKSFDAVVVTTSHAMEVGSRSMLVELQADNADGRLFSGAYCQVHFLLPGDPNMLRLPATALVPVNRGVQVAVLDSQDRVTMKPVQLGRDFGDSVEVVAGLAPSDRVIDSPPETLQAGDSVQLVTASQKVAPSS
jgi:membrane fusion protein, multidrug efflux system